MKKSIAVLMMLCLLLAPTACGQGDQTNQTAQSDDSRIQDENTIVLSDDGVTMDGSTLSDSGTVYASHVTVTNLEGNEVFSLNIAADPVLSEENRTFQGVILSCAGLELEQTCQVQVNDVSQIYTGTDVQMRPGMGGGFGGGRGQRPDDIQQQPADGIAPPALPEGMENRIPPDDTQMPQQGEGNTLFDMWDKVNNFSGVADAEEQKKHPTGVLFSCLISASAARPPLLHRWRAVRWG